MLSEVRLQLGNFSVSVVQDTLLSIELGVQISILLLSVNEQVLLVIDFLSQSRDHVDVHFNSALVVILHSSLLISYSIEVLLKSKKLVLEKLVFTFS